MATTPQNFEEILQAALLAPSGDNCQPFSYHVENDSIEIHFDHNRSASFIDVKNTASWISLGATLANIAIAAKTKGLQLQTELNLKDDFTKPIAKLSFVTCAPVTDSLFHALPVRCSNRRAYETTPLPGKLISDCKAFASSPKVQIDFVQDPAAIKRIAKAQAQFDRIVIEHRGIHDYLYTWLRWTKAEIERTRDGMPVKTLELNPIDRGGFRLLGREAVRSFFTRIGLSKMAPLQGEKIYARSGAIGLISVQGKNPDDFVKGGDAMERVWLTLAAEGWSFQPLTGFLFLLLRRRLAGDQTMDGLQRRLLDDFLTAVRPFLPAFEARTPIMLFRVGKAGPPSERTLRRNLKDVLR